MSEHVWEGTKNTFLDNNFMKRITFGSHCSRRDFTFHQSFHEI
jgi:hypothetical protein